jgi:hypothetical protein
MGNGFCTRDTAFRYPDYIAATMQCPGRLIARITANFGCVHRHQHVLRLFGTQATFIYDDAGPRWHTTRDPSMRATPLTLPPLPASKGALIGPFVEAILSDADFGEETQTHFDVISVCVACDASVRHRSIEEIRYV